jgi:hypothetical protein
MTGEALVSALPLSCASPSTSSALSASSMSCLALKWILSSALPVLEPESYRVYDGEHTEFSGPRVQPCPERP